MYNKKKRYFLELCSKIIWSIYQFTYEYYMCTYTGTYLTRTIKDIINYVLNYFTFYLQG